MTARYPGMNRATGWVCPIPDKAVVMMPESVPNILERDCALKPTAVTRVQVIINNLRDEMARKIAESDSCDG